MSYLKREIEPWIEKLSKQFAAILLTGPRQVGKTTLLQELSHHSRQYISFDDLALRELAKKDPRLFLSQYKAPLLLDEIQYVPELLPYLKMEIDNQKRPGMYWLTGSQPFHVMKNISESLTGRVAVLSLLGFSQREKKHKIDGIIPFLPDQSKLFQDNNHKLHDDIFQYIYRGSMPALNIENPPELETYLNSYLQTYLLRDLRDLSQVTDLTKFTRFIRLCAARTGQLLNYSDLARDADISVPTAKHWISILENSYIVILIQPYHNNISKRLVKTPKLYFTDTGLCAYLTGWSSPKTLMNGAMSGAIFETFVVTEIIKSYWNAGKQANISFYRDKDMKEIDLLIESDNTLYPVEIKLSGTVSRDWVKNFGVLNKINKEIGTGAVICLTETPQFINENNIAINVGQI